MSTGTKTVQRNAIRELDIDVRWRATGADADAAVPLDDEHCLGAVSCINRHISIHGSKVVRAQLKTSSAYLTTADGTVWHGIPDANTAMLIAANDNPLYKPRGNVVFAVLAPSPSQTLDATYAYSKKSKARAAAGLPPKGGGSTEERPDYGKTKQVRMKPRGSARFDRSAA